MSASDAMGLAGLVLSIVGIPLAFVLARRGRKRPLLRYVVDFQLIASSKQGGFAAGFMRSVSGEPITRISRTTIALWNHQGDTMRGIDIVPQDRLRIQLDDDDQVLQVRIASKSRGQNALCAEVDPEDQSIVNIDFDFLDSGDGGLIEVIHQGAEPPCVTGTIRGSSLEQRSRLNLSPETQVVMAKPWYKRLKDRVPPRIAVLLVLTVGTGTSGVVLAIGDFFRPPPVLVDYVKYNLRTLEGQRDLAREVSHVGLLLVPFPVWVSALFIVLIVFMITLLFWRIVRVRVPRSIIKISSELEANGGNLTSEPRSDVESSAT